MASGNTVKSRLYQEVEGYIIVRQKCYSFATVAMCFSERMQENQGLWRKKFEILRQE